MGIVNYTKGDVPGSKFSKYFRLMSKNKNKRCEEIYNY